MSGNTWCKSILCPHCNGHTKLSRLTRGSRKCYSCGKIVPAKECVYKEYINIVKVPKRDDDMKKNDYEKKNDINEKAKFFFEQNNLTLKQLKTTLKILRNPTTRWIVEKTSGKMSVEERKLLEDWLEKQIYLMGQK